MARELGRSNIRVNAIAPGATDTEVVRATVTPEQKALQISMRSLRREQSVEDLTGVALYLCSDASRFVTGQVFTVDGGLSYT